MKVFQSRRCLLLLNCCLLSGCASFSTDGLPPESDPFESTNRKLFTLNQHIDTYALKPMAQGYRAVTPAFVRQGLRNVFANLQLIPTLVNDSLQLRPKEASQDVARLTINSTLGFLGVFDVASPMGLTKRSVTFGSTLQHYGITYSPYLMLPILGPSTVRDTAGDLVDSLVNPVRIYGNSDQRLASQVIAGVSRREGLLDKEELAEVISFDEYVFIRNAYLQKIGADLDQSATTLDDLSGYQDEFADEFD